MPDTHPELQNHSRADSGGDSPTSGDSPLRLLFFLLPYRVHTHTRTCTGTCSLNIFHYVKGANCHTHTKKKLTYLMHAANFCMHWVAALLCTKGGGRWGHLPLCVHQEFNYPCWLRTPAKLVISLSPCITTADAQMWGRRGGGGGGGVEGVVGGVLAAG